MANYILTSGNDILTGTADADVFDGYANGGRTGGSDRLNGGAGDDLFSLGIGYNGTINGGDGLDTVRLNGAGAPFDMALAGAVLSRVEVLDLRGGSVGLTASQLSAFATITNSANTNDRIEFYLDGGGLFDFSSRVGGALSVQVEVTGAAASVIGTANADILHGRGEADTLDGRAGADVFRGRAGSGAMKGGDGNDRFEIEQFDGAGRLDGGGGVDSLVALTADLGSAVFDGIEILNLTPTPGDFARIKGSVSQLGSFSEIKSSARPNSQITIEIVGGGTIDFSGKLGSGHTLRASLATSEDGGTIVGTARNDILSGGNGNDVLRGGEGADDLINVGDLFPPGGFDTLNGEAGNDRFYLQGGRGTVDGGSGIDTVYAWGRENPIGSYLFKNVEVLNIDTGIEASIRQLSYFSKIEKSGISGGQVTFYLTGAGGSLDFSTRVSGPFSIALQAEEATSGISIVGTLRGDNLSGSNYADTLNGGNGNDTLSGMGGADRLIGGQGNDTYVVSAGDTVVELAGQGTDTVMSEHSYTLGAMLENLTLVGARASVGSGNGLANVMDGSVGWGANILRGLGGNDVYIVGYGDVVDETVAGSGGIDTVRSTMSHTLSASVENLVLLESATKGVGNSLNNVITGTAWANTLSGGAGNDTLRGGYGGDTLIGGIGNDTYVLEDKADVINDDAGIDIVISTVSQDLAKYASIENLALRGTSAINGAGNTLSNSIAGNDAANVIDGAGGNDVLYGGLGHDTLIGGAGSDSFVLNTALNSTTNVDRIADFNVAADTIRLDNAVMAGLGLATGALAAGKFWKSTSGLAHDADDRIIYETDTGKLFYDANGNASGGAVLIATLAANLALTNADFVVI